MKKILFISLVLITILTQAQNTKFAIGIINGIDYYNYSFWGFPDTYTTADGRTKLIPEGNHKFNNVINFSIGLKFEYNLKNILIGVNIMNLSKGYKIEYDMPKDVYNSPVYEISYLKFNYNDFGLNIGYTFFQDKKMSIVPSLGFTYSILSNTNNIIKLSNGSFTKDENYTDVFVQHTPEKNLYSINGAVSFKLALGTRIKLILTPYFAQYLNQLEKQAMDKNPMAYGARLSVVYCFGKSKKEE